MPYFPPAITVRSPANQTAITDVSGQHVGLGAIAAPNTCDFTTGTGRALVILTGNMVASNTATTQTARFAYGTGAGPANATEQTGTLVGVAQSFVALTGHLTMPLALMAVITGLTPGTLYWIDLVITSSANSGQLTNGALVVIEL